MLTGPIRKQLSRQWTTVSRLSGTVSPASSRSAASGTSASAATDVPWGPAVPQPFGKKPTRGVCGAEADLIVARNLLDDLTTGAAAHSDHGREVVEAMLATSEGRAQGYQIHHEGKLHVVATEYGIKTAGRKKKRSPRRWPGRCSKSTGR